MTNAIAVLLTHIFCQTTISQDLLDVDINTIAQTVICSYYTNLLKLLYVVIVPTYL
jgi:hypothetical protein